LKLSFKSTSKHLAILFGAGIADKEQKSLSMFYSVAEPLPKIAKHIRDIL